ncbi:DegT/DnrJ/EryC1/StrS family aminotransferase [Archangium sp.]|uniref:DegT/DnrJ/EryC1/StrS family aminotransferase n=1 Tax=Archangium sp. TaxID=1872627 RepID=UPI002D2A4860|nr:aminotransferase class I/II-fold pyridoxal phosphate-dependent enzyme [Archangium sp.]HYO54446.1 aminotransferase class I/II-fold pyridoxal phosphate-dependent enzyme [Archangium sp.]
MNREIFLSCQFKAHRDEAELEGLIQAIRASNSLSGDSTVVAEYEARLASHFGTRHAIAVSSGTAAIHAALEACITPGNEVLVPVIAVPMTVNAVLQAGGKPVFYDRGERGFIPCLDSLERYRSDRARVVLTVSMWGYPAIDEALLEFARHHHLVIIEDTAQGLGTVNRQRFEGTIGDIGCFSTHEFKLMSTGEGGFVLTNHEEVATRIRSFSRIGFDAKRGGFGHRPGINYKLSSPQAALGLYQLANLAAKVTQRNGKMDRWRQALLAHPRVRDFFDAPDVALNGYSAVLTLVDAEPGLARRLAETLYGRGILTDIHRYKQSYMTDFPLYQPFYQQGPYTGDKRRDFPNATRFIDSAVVLPTHDSVTPEQIDRAVLIILEELDSLGG